MNLRHLLLPVLEFFEVQLRAKIAYQLAITYGSLGYMDAENFRAETLANGSSVHKNLMGKFKNEVKRQARCPLCAITKSNTAASSRSGRRSSCLHSACWLHCLTS